MAKSIDDIRKEIDSTDRAIQDLIRKRADLVHVIAAEKRKANAPFIQPHREAALVRKLLDRHEGAFPREAIARIWREITGAVSLLQTSFKVVVTVPDDPSGLLNWDLAKDYYSSVVPLQRVTNPLAAMTMVREGDAQFAVMPWPEDNAPNPWWHNIIGDNSGDPAMQIVARLPFGDAQESENNLSHRALVIGRTNFEPSGDDRSFLALAPGQDISRGKIVEIASAFDMPPRSLNVTSGHEGQRTIYFLEVEGFVAPDDERLTRLVQELESPDAYCYCLGGYPVPPVYSDTVGRGALAG